MIFRNGVLALFSLALIASSSFLYFANKSGNLSRYIASNQQASLYCVTLGLWLSDSDCVKNFQETIEVPPPVINKYEDVNTNNTDKVSVVEVVRETPIINNYYITNKDSINNQVSSVSPSVVNRDFLTKQVDAVYNSLGRSVSDVSTSITDLTTTDVEEEDNLYYTDSRVSTYLSGSTTLTSSLNYWTKSGSQLSYANGNVVIDGTITATTTELITNGSFTGSATGWTLGDNASYGTNNAISAYVGGDSSIRTTFNSVSGKTYKLTFTISGSNIPVDVLFNNNSYGNTTGKFRNGTHSLVLLTDFTGLETVIFQDSSSVVGSTWTLDNVSIKEVNTAVRPLSVLGFDGESLMSFGDNVSGNINFGISSFNTNATGIENNAFGAFTLRNNTTGSYNTANGYSALFSNTTGNSNTATGYDALSQNTTGSNNVAYGMQAMEYNQTGSANSSFGSNSMSDNTTGQANTAIGYGALESNLTGSFNTALGVSASAYNMSATSTTAVGYRAGSGDDYFSNQGGVYLGYQSGYSLGNNSDYNTFLGYQSGYNVTTGKNNILLSTATSSTAIANLTTGSQNILIGANVSLPSATASGQLNIGNIIYGTGNTGTGSTLSTGKIGIGTTSPASKLSITQSANTSAGGIWLAGTDGDYRSIYMSDTSGTLSFAGGDTAGASNIATLNSAGAWTNASDRSYKEEIVNLDTKYNLETLMKIEPRYYTMKGSGKPQIGFIAQELKLILPEVVEGEEGSMGISYGNMVALLVTAVKEINVKVGKIVSEIKVLVLDSITAKVAIFDRSEMEVASVSKGLEMKDQVSGETYCIMIKNGDWDKTRGKCSEVVNTTQESNTNTNTNNSNSANNDNSNNSTPTTSTTTPPTQESDNSGSSSSEPTETTPEPSVSPEPTTTPTTTPDPTPTPSTVVETPVTIEPPQEPSQTEVPKSEPAPEPEPEPAPIPQEETTQSAVTE